MPDDQAQTILAPTQVDNGLKADAWEAFKSSANERELGARLQGMNLPQKVKADLWEAKRGMGQQNTEAAQVAARPLGNPQPIPAELQPTERAMQYSMGGMPQFVDVPKGTRQQFEAAGRRGADTGGKIGLALTAVPGAIEAPVATGLALAGGYVGGKVGKYAGQIGAKALGASPKTAETVGDVGEFVGGITGGTAGGIGVPMARQALGRKIYTPSGDLSPWTDALTHPTKLPEKVLRTVVPEPPQFPGAQLPSSEDFYAAREANAVKLDEQMTAMGKARQAELAANERLKNLDAQSRMTRWRQQDLLDVKAAKDAPQPSPFQGMTSTAGGAPPVAAAPTMPQGNPTPFVNKFSPPEPNRIVGPDSPPPSMKVTYQSYPREALYQMAKQGDIEAGLELIRNPKNFSLPPNFKFLIEESAKKMPWRNLNK